MRIQFEYPDLRELEIQKIEVVDREGDVVATFALQHKEQTWYATVDVLEKQFHYKFRLNEEIYFVDPYADEYAMMDGEVWSIRCCEQSKTQNRIERIEQFDIVVSNQMNHSVRSSNVHKNFIAKLEKRVNVGVECYSVAGVHELLVVWSSPEQRIYRMDYKILEPEQEGERYGIIVWFKLRLDEIETELIKGVWIVKVLLDGVLIGFEMFRVEDL